MKLPRALAAGAATVLLGVAAEPAVAAPSYRVVDGEISYEGSATLSCTYPAGDCGDFSGGYRLGSKSVRHGTNVAFSVHAPGATAPDEVRAPLAVDAWTHQYDATSNYSQSPCGSDVTTTVSDSDLRHDGGTDPSVYEVAVRIAPAASPAAFSVALLPPQGTEPRFGWVWPTGLRWSDSGRYPTVLDTSGGSGDPLCVGGGSLRRPIVDRNPFDFYPTAQRTLRTTPPTYGAPRCAAGRCVVRASGATSWSYGGAPGGNTLTGSMAITWWLDVETTGTPAGACRDGVDNDRDGARDHGPDPGCASPADPSELGTTACDNGVDDDGDGFVDVAGGDPECEGPQDDDEGPACAPVRSAPPGYVGRFLGRETEEIQYDVEVRWCTNGRRVEVRSVDLDVGTGLGSTPSYLGAFERVLRDVADLRTDWQPGGDQWRFLPGGADHVALEVGGGSAVVCTGVLPGVGRLAKFLRMRALKQVGKLGKPLRKALGRKLEKKLKSAAKRGFQKARTIERKRIEARLKKEGLTKKQRKKRSLPEAKENLAFYERLVLDAIGDLVDDLIVDLAPLRPICAPVWTPAVRVHLSTSGTQSWTETNGPRFPRLWQVDRLR